MYAQANALIQPPRLRTASPGAHPPCLRTFLCRYRCPASLEPRGRGLSRPECVLATATGDLYTADWRGGVAMLAADGSQTLISGGRCRTAGRCVPTASRSSATALSCSRTWATPRAACSVWRRDGTVTPVVVDVDGMRLPPTNFVLIDAQLRLWITVSTRRVPRALGYRA